MIDHLSLPVSDVEATTRVYAAALKPIGYAVVMDFTREQVPQLPFSQTTGLGAKGKPDLWLRPARHAVDGTHVALRVEHRKDVDAFPAAAIAAGLKDDGGPGVRAHYHPHYYAAFVRDADGHSLEVVCHAPPPAKKPASKKKKVVGKKKR
jgi:catechol 2,3-dioxygenase-like lactoylglutathione lyase family enzyme